jgi:hypothetical protein
LPGDYQQKYGMFLKGIGFSADSVKISQTGFSFSGLQRKRIKIKNGKFKTKPFTAEFKGTILQQMPWKDSKLSPLIINVVNMSDDLKNLLTNLGFFKNPKHKKQQHLSIRLTGPVNSPHVKQKK